MEIKNNQYLKMKLRLFPYIDNINLVHKLKIDKKSISLKSDFSMEAICNGLLIFSDHLSGRSF